MADQINFQIPLNVSVQVGDQLYYNKNSVPTLVGNISDKGTDEETGLDYVLVDADTSPNGLDLQQNEFFMFKKDEQINNSRLLGYYADVKLVQDSTKKAELFSLGSEVTESSK